MVRKGPPEDEPLKHVFKLLFVAFNVLIGIHVTACTTCEDSKQMGSKLFLTEHMTTRLVKMLFSILRPLYTSHTYSKLSLYSATMGHEFQFLATL